jgi:hypothetical protein
MPTVLAPSNTAHKIYSTQSGDAIALDHIHSPLFAPAYLQLTVVVGRSYTEPGVWYPLCSPVLWVKGLLTVKILLKPLRQLRTVINGKLLLTLISFLGSLSRTCTQLFYRLYLSSEPYLQPSLDDHQGELSLMASSEGGSTRGGAIHRRHKMLGSGRCFAWGRGNRISIETP